MQIRVIDLFAGAGGLSQGFKEAGFEIIYANEIDEQFCKTFSKNHKKTIVDNRDINTLNIKKEFKRFKGTNIVAGGPPCQGFSQKGNRKGLQDDRNFLFKKFIEVVDAIQPEVFVMENVPNLITSSDGYFFKEIKGFFNLLGYSINHKILNAYDYGIPQKRRRAFLIGNRISKKFIFPAEEYLKVNVEEAISDLPKLKSGEGKNFQDYSRLPKSNYQRMLRKKSKGIYNHIATNHSEGALEKLSLIPPFGDKSNLPTQLRTKSIYSGTWGRIDPKGPSRTITTRFDTPSSGEFTLNKQDRCLTVREAARLQSFSDKFIFYGNKSSQMKQVGNAVPPLLAKKIGVEIAKLF